MIPVLFPALERTFTNNGLGGLPNAISCFVTEKRNTPGGYYLEMEYPIDGLHFGDIIQERIIFASPAPGIAPEPFRIQRISRPINGIVQIEAPHVSSELRSITAYGTFADTHSAKQAFDQFVSVAERSGQSVDFEFYTDGWSDSGKTISFPTPTSLQDILFGVEGSILENFGGEFAFYNRRIELTNARGKDTGIEIRYGINMSDIESETDSSELVTAVVPYWSGDIDGVQTVIIGDICLSANADAFAYLRTIPLDVTSKFEGTDAPTKAQVNSAGLAFVGGTELQNLNVSTRVKYTPEYFSVADRPIYLCDTVKVVHPDLQVSNTAKIVETRYNVLTERYDEITIGSIKKSIVDTIAKMIKKG